MLEHWQKVSLLLCIFGFLRELRPSEPFAVEFFINYRNITNDELTNYYFPIGTYSYMIQLIIAFLITDLMRYKPIIVFSTFIGMLLFGLLSWSTKEAVVYGQFSYGTFMACEVAYYTYIYAKVERSKYQLVTGQTRSAILSGRFIGSAVAQLLISFELMNYHQLNYLSFAFQCFSLIFALLLPSVNVSLYFYSNTNADENRNQNGNVNCPASLKHTNSNPTENHVKKISANGGCDFNLKEKFNSTHCSSVNAEMPTFSLMHAIQRIANHISTSYTNKTVVQWSILWAMSMCGFLQVQSYIQTLWKEIDPNEIKLYNGAVEALITLLGAMSAFMAGSLNSRSFNRFEIWIMSALMLVEGMLLLWAALTVQLWCCYVSYVIFGMIYHFMITIASASVAKKLHEECFALIFGINTLVALFLQSMLTFVVITHSNLPLRVQYQLYSCIFFVLALIYGLTAVTKSLYQRKKSYQLDC